MNTLCMRMLCWIRISECSSTVSVNVFCQYTCAAGVGARILPVCQRCWNAYGVSILSGYMCSAACCRLPVTRISSSRRPRLKFGEATRRTPLRARARWGPAKCVEVHGRPARDSCCRLPAPAGRFVSHSRGLVRTKASYRRQCAGGQAGATEPIDLGAAGRGAGS
jgi:hypothetical protein